MYNVELEVFQGPMDLLLHLIEKMEIDIHNIPIEKLTDSYLEYIKQLDEISLENAEDYIVMASTLILIKSKSLLPKDEEADYIEEELVTKLVDYKNYKEIQSILSEMQEIRNNFGEKENEEILLDSKLMNMPAKKLYVAFKNILENSNKLRKLEENIRYRKEISIEKIREEIIFKIKSYDSKFEFEKFILNFQTRDELVAAFICILDMLREQLIICNELGEKLYIAAKDI
ncbi:MULTISPECIES: ScpA family protein [unclassified Gemella]|uniref:segregation and condensation protein A n=1 Tax=unclassified Gemella TaxID=2624949 RepID=UPI001C04C509|nr:MULTISPECIES: segregation/condensation protein A [unclassified Gemella]MBU0278345.1 segregation/condensation protein A [Gemella sp. zg-1178]QWQ38154.1 segregation/condensation protein A [Gemella sp. zg-570]